MNDDDVLQAFVEAPLPPSRVSVDRAIRAGRRRQRTRIGLTGLALVGVIAVGAFAAFPVARGDGTAAGDRTQITISATGADGGPPSADGLSSAATTVQDRLRASGFLDATVSVVDGQLIAVVRGRPATDEIAADLAPGALTVRKVIDVVPSLTNQASVPPWRAATPPLREGQPPNRAEVLAKVGEPAATAAEAITDQTQAQTDPALEPFRHLTPAEAATLPLDMQLRVPQISCSTLDARPIDAVAAEPGPVVACDTTGTKFLLDSAKVTNAGLASAVAKHLDLVWRVELTFNLQGQPQWTALTAEAYENTGGACVATAPRAAGGDGVCQVAFVVDNMVLSAPAIQAVITGPAEMTGGSETEAKQLAGELSGGRLRLALRVQAVEPV